MPARCGHITVDRFVAQEGCSSNRQYSIGIRGLIVISYTFKSSHVILFGMGVSIRARHFWPFLGPGKLCAVFTGCSCVEPAPCTISGVEIMEFRGVLDAVFVSPRFSVCKLELPCAMCAYVICWY